MTLSHCGVVASGGSTRCVCYGVQAGRSTQASNGVIVGLVSSLPSGMNSRPSLPSCMPLDPLLRCDPSLRAPLLPCSQALTAYLLLLAHTHTLSLSHTHTHTHSPTHTDSHIMFGVTARRFNGSAFPSSDARPRWYTLAHHPSTSGCLPCLGEAGGRTWLRRAWTSRA